MSTKAKDRKVNGKKAKTTAIKATTASARKVKNGDFASLVEAKKTKLHEAMADTRIAELKVEEPPDLRMPARSTIGLPSASCKISSATG
jgi:hypothetical protein